MNKKTPPRSCLQTAVAILEYADNTEQSLREKLEKRGYGREEISAAIALLKEKRLFSERDYAFRYAYSAAKSKQWGPRRILLSMREKGFAEENLRAVESAFGAAFGSAGDAVRQTVEDPGGSRSGGNENSAIENLLSSLDFPGICAILMMRNLRQAAYTLLRGYFESGDLPSDRVERQKLYASRQKLCAALLRRGFSMDTIRDAEDIVREKLREECADEDEE